MKAKIILLFVLCSLLGSFTVPAPGTAASAVAPAPGVNSPEPPLAQPSVPVDPKANALAEVREAIQRGLWTQAETEIQRVAEMDPGDGAADRLRAELAEAKESAVAGLRDRIEAARAADDPERIFAQHGGVIATS